MGPQLRRRRWAGIVLCLSTATASTPTVAAEFDLLLDTDNDPATGCAVTTADGAFDGVELRLRTAVDSSTDTVGQVTRAQCADPASGAFAPATVERSGGWPVGSGLGTQGSSVIETALDAPGSGAIRVGLAARAGSGEDALLTRNGGTGGSDIVLPGVILAPEAIPALSAVGATLLAALMLLVVVRSRGLGSSAWSVALAISVAGAGIGVALAATLDGDPADWQGEMPVAEDALGDGAPDVVALFAQRMGQDTLVFRIDAFLDQPPVATDDGPFTVDEDATLNVSAADGVLGNDSDPEGATLSAVLESPPSDGALTLNADGSFTYTPDPDFAGSDSFTYRADDGSGVSSPATVGLEVTPVNDAPTFTPGPDVSAPENSGAQTFPAWASDIDPGAAQEAGQTLSFQVTNNTDPSLFQTAPAIAVPSGDLSFTPATDAVGSAEITIRLVDDGGTANGGVDTSAPATFTVTIDEVNDPPQAVDDSATTDEDTAVTASVLANDNDPDGTLDPATVAVATAPSSGTTSVDAASGDITYTPNADFNGSDSFTYTVNDDGGAISNPATVTVTVDPVNDAPGFTPGGDENVLEDAGAQTVTGWATAIDPGAANETGQTLTFNVSNDNNGLFASQPAIDSGGTLTYTPAAEANGSATVTVTLSDDGGTANGGDDTSAAQTFTVTVTPVNDPPVFTAGTDPVVNEDSGAQTTVWATGISPGPANEAGQTLNFTVTETGKDSTASFSAAPTIDAATGELQFTPAANAYGSATFEVTLIDSGGTANGGADSFGPVALTVTMDPLNDAPTVSVVPAFSASTNIQIDVPAGSGLLANAADEATEASDPAGPAAPGTNLTVGNGANPAPTSTANGGDLTINTSDGSFSYNPPPGFTGTDSFSYVVCDDGIGTPSSQCSGSITVDIGVSGNKVWFVDNAAGSSGDGRLTSPFDSLAAFNAQQGGGGTADPAAGDVIFVHTGSGAYSDGSAGIALLNDQVLFGQATSGTTFDAFAGISPPPTSVARPSLGGTAPVLEATSGNAVNVSTGASSTNTVRGLDIGNTTGGAGIAGTFQGTLTVDEVNISGAGALLALSGASQGTLNADFGSLSSTQTSAGLAGLRVADAPGSSLTATSTSVGSPSANAIELLNNTGGSSFNLGALSDIATTAGHGLLLQNTGSVSIAATTPSISAAGGAALFIDGTSVSGFNFSSLSAVNASNGVSLSNVAGDVTGAGGTLQGMTGPAFDVDAGSDPITYAGTIDNSAGRSVEVTNRGGGTITLSGVISDTGTGILLNNNTGGTIAFTNSLTLDTGTNNAFTATGAGTVTATGTGSSVTTTTGVPVTVANTSIGGAGMTFQSISADGSPNGIVLDNTGASGAFTVTGDGTLARNGSGGMIQNTTGDAVFLNNANNVALKQMDLLDIGDTADPSNITSPSNDHAIESRGGGNITLEAVHIVNPIGSGWEAFDITGDNGVRGDSVIEALDQTSNFAGLRVTNNNVSFTNLDIVNSTFDHADPTPGDAANNGNAMVVVSMRGSAGGAFNVEGSTFTGARGTAITVNSGDAAGSTGTLTSNIQSSTFVVAHPINGQNNIGMQAIEGTTHNKLVDGNTLRDIGRGASLSGQIIMQKSDTATMDAEANNNAVSEVPEQHGIDALSLSTSSGGKVDWEAEGNTIFNVGRRGIFNSARGGEPDMDIAMRSNTVGRDLSGAVDPVGFDSTVQRGVEIDVQTDAFLQGIVTNNEVISNTSGTSTGGLASSVMFVNVEEFGGGTATAHITIDTNTFTNQDGTGSPNFLARTRDSGLTKALDFNAVTANGMSSMVTVNEASGSTVTVEDLADVAADNPGVSTFNIGAGVTDHGGNVPEPDF